MTISAQIIADSISPQGKRITTFQLRYPRMIHSEFMTHRVFSRNASSSRAIPVAKMIEEIKRDPAMPVFWGSNKPGMQAGVELDEHDISGCKEHWLIARDEAIASVEVMMETYNLHKQIANRVLEPWAHINVVVTATEWSNFFALRCHPMAQPEIRVLAEQMRFAMDGSKPMLLQPGEWHLPYVTDEEWAQADEPGFTLPMLIQRSVARCARVSYMTFEMKKPSLEEDLQLYDRLVGSHPMHASPAEHQATPDRLESAGISDWTNGWQNQSEHGNFIGWRQYRKTLPGECQ